MTIPTEAEGGCGQGTKGIIWWYIFPFTKPPPHTRPLKTCKGSTSSWAAGFARRESGECFVYLLEKADFAQPQTPKENPQTVVRRAHTCAYVIPPRRHRGPTRLRHIHSHPHSLTLSPPLHVHPFLKQLLFILQPPKSNNFLFFYICNYLLLLVLYVSQAWDWHQFHVQQCSLF